MKREKEEEEEEYEKATESERTTQLLACWNRKQKLEKCNIRIKAASSDELALAVHARRSMLLSAT